MRYSSEDGVFGLPARCHDNFDPSSFLHRTLINPPVMKQPPNVALAIETSNRYARGLLHGICTYIRKFGPWTIHYAEHSRGESPPEWLARWRGDGIIARIENPSIAEPVAALGLPTVDVSAARLLPDVPCVETDDEAIARVAVEHFRERGFKHLAFCNVYGFNWSKYRCDHFMRFVAAANLTCHVYRPPSVVGLPNAWQQDMADLSRWVKSLPRPVGILAGWDGCGLRLLDACRGLGIAVPDEVAVLGVDDDELLCDLAEPRLSSIITDPYRIGYEAAAQLDRLMAGESPSALMTVFPPLGIATRQSTDGLAVEDAEIAQAVHYIRRNACQGINVSDVVEAVALSRRGLEERFKKVVGRTPHEEIVRVQLQRVKELLTETDLSVAAIAGRTGFRHVEYLSAVFKKKVGVPPSEFRVKARP